MAIIDNTLAAQIPTFDPATPLAEAAKVQGLQAESQAAQFKQRQTEIGSEARGLMPFVNSPEFPAKWAETADRMHQKGLLDDRSYNQWRNTPSPLLLKQMIASTEDPTLTFQKEEAGRAQKNSDRNYLLAQRTADRLDEGPVEQAGYREQVAKKYGLDPNTPEGKSYIISGTLPDSVSGQGPKVGLQPTFGVGADGRPAAIQFTDKGTAVKTKLPDDFTISKDPIKIDAGTHFILLDPQTRQQIGMIPKNIAGAEKAKEVGSAEGIAQVGLPQTLATSEGILKTLDEIQNHPGKEYSLGLYSKAPTIPGTSQADFRAAAAQLKGQTFLQAYNSLKGGGAITDIEGKKAEDAIARLDQAQTTAAYDGALNDFRKVIKSGMERAKAKAGAGPSSDQSAAKPPASERFQQLTKSGLDKKAAYSKMTEEGY